VEAFSDLTGQIQKKQEQVASGKEMTKPSDDPVKANRVMIVESQLSQAEQYIRNIDISSVKLGLTESALDQVSNLLTRAYELSVQARSDAAAGGRPAVVVELEGLLDNIKDLANSSDASGRAIFGGFKLGDTPFSTDVSGNTQYVGDRGVHKVKISQSMNLQTTLDGSTVFERVPLESGQMGSVFSLLEGMITDLKSGDATSMPINDLKSAIAHVADQRAFVGSQMNKADLQLNKLENRTATLTRNIGEMQDADLGKIVTDLQSLLLNKEIAQKTFSRISQLSLFDYLS
jgi:flagellar hook-associated protein 3 FlgL